MTEKNEDNYKIRVIVDNAEALPEDIHLALQALAERVAQDERDGGEVEGFGMQKLEIGLGRSGPATIAKQPESWCIGYTSESSDKDGWGDGNDGSCWINWF